MRDEKRNYLFLKPHTLPYRVPHFPLRLDPRFEGGLFSLENLEHLKPSLIINLYDNGFSLENHVSEILLPHYSTQIWWDIVFITSPDNAAELLTNVWIIFSDSYRAYSIAMIIQPRYVHPRFSRSAFLPISYSLIFTLLVSFPLLRSSSKQLIPFVSHLN